MVGAMNPPIFDGKEIDDQTEVFQHSVPNEYDC